jgi:1-acyl-sn-glycerol-3-phosphate acyltransferase
LPWKPGAVRFSQAAQVPIVLVYVDVNHSIARQVSQRLHGVVRALMQVWAYRFGRSLKLHLHVLDVVTPEQLPEGSAQQQTNWLQARFEKLAAEVVKA